MVKGGGGHIGDRKVLFKVVTPGRLICSPPVPRLLYARYDWGNT